MDQQPEKYISVKEARELMGVSISKMTRLLKEGVIPARRSIKDERKKLLKLSDVQKWIDQAKLEEDGAAPVAIAC